MRAGWEVVAGVATWRRSNVVTTLEVNDGVATVTHESGSGHAAQYTNATIPMDVVVEMMRAAGYAVVAPTG